MCSSEKSGQVWQAEAVPNSSVRDLIYANFAFTTRVLLTFILGVRFPSTATPSYYLPAPAVRTEDDVIYRPTLPDFRSVDTSAEDGESTKKAPPILTQRDSELLIS